ncbi:calcium/calmodulin-dependent 3',5'-cyclic nucleotide phosphodiesterase 1A isoform X2 [Silurus asotus]|uniref:Calcium/calmodulin-dependent 3',5'-cyclic nucleotide phosphodiesterase 1A isoform X2 n=1 Tax=Silurus asotus TaxID=30991 RepID=A0AAD5A2P4_SILAS|nr:calcium/calmodulin-dependent 3',5'-cyclic nucleotide phosphodiesterase 1A isoform X2 [Silurus asotus]
MCLQLRVANEDGESNSRPPAMFARSKSQSALWNTITSGLGSKEKVKGQRSIADDPRSPEEILAEEFPSVDSPDATEKAAIRCKYDGTAVTGIIYTLTDSSTGLVS